MMTNPTLILKPLVWGQGTAFDHMAHTDRVSKKKSHQRVGRRATRQFEIFEVKSRKAKLLTEPVYLHWFNTQ
eukprot:5520403-Amphidinium_carterae.1